MTKKINQSILDHIKLLCYDVVNNSPKVIDSGRMLIHISEEDSLDPSNSIIHIIEL